MFFDYDGIASGDFEQIILGNIKARAHFLVLLTPSALERCDDPADWLRREIEVALESQRNIVPLMLEGFDFGTPAIANQLSGKLAALKHYNALNIPAAYFAEAMDRLRSKYLSVPLDAVLHPASLSAQRAATGQKAAAKAAPVPDLVDRLSNKDDAERARIFRVGTQNNIVFGALTEALGKRISRYNERHPPQDRWSPNSLIIHTSPHDSSTQSSFEIKKTSRPASSLKVEFPINSGEMTFYGPATGGKRNIITLDIKDNAPIYSVSGMPYSVDDIADFLLHLFFPD